MARSELLKVLLELAQHLLYMLQVLLLDLLPLGRRLFTLALLLKKLPNTSSAPHDGHGSNAASSAGVRLAVVMLKCQNVCMVVKCLKCLSRHMKVHLHFPLKLGRFSQKLARRID